MRRRSQLVAAEGTLKYSTNDLGGFEMDRITELNAWEVSKLRRMSLEDARGTLALADTLELVS